MRDYRLPKSRRHSRIKPLVRKKTHHRPRVIHRSGGGSSGSSFFQKIGLILVILLVLGGIGYGLFMEVLPKLIPLKNSKTIVIVSSTKDKSDNQIMVAHFKPEDSVITAAAIPADQPVMVAGGFGEYPLRSVWPLLDMENKDDAFIRSAFSFAVGEAIDGVVVTSEATIPTSQFELQTEMRQAIQHRSVAGLGLKDQLALYFFTTQLPSEKVRIKSLDVWEAWERYRGELGLLFPEADCPVAVVNTTNQSGLATAVAKVVEQSGYTVVRVTDNPEAEPHSRVAYAADSEECQVKAASLGHLFPQKVEVTADSATTQTYRAKIILELGEDIRSIIPTTAIQ